MGVARSLALALVALALCGCSNDGPAPDEPVGTAPGADGLTPPGAVLKVGDTATVPRTGGTGVLELTVTGIEQGRFSDLEDFDDQGGGPVTPYYVSYDVTLVSGDGDGLAVRDYLSAWADDEQAGPLVSFEPFPRCQEANFPRQAVVVGTAVSSCKTYLVDEADAPVDTIRFDNHDGTRVAWQ